jgi:hypothetical protein
MSALGMVVPMFRLWRDKRRHRRELLRAFLIGLDSGQLRVRARDRCKSYFGQGFIDEYLGTCGMIRFRLVAKIEPYAVFHVVSLGLYSSADAGMWSYEYWKHGWHPDTINRTVARIYLAVRRRCKTNRSTLEASS